MDYAMRGRITALILNTGGSMEVVAGVLSICSESEREAGILRDALAESERLRVEAESVRELLYSKITDWFDVEDWTNHEKGITEVDAHLNAIDSVAKVYAERDDLAAKVAALTALVAQSSTQYREMVKALEEYGSHQLPCPLAQWSQGRPTKDGGYETMYAGKWYQDDDKPTCTCGFDSALERSTP